MAILFVGSETGELCAEAQACGVHATHAESFIEGILLSGEDSPYGLIVAGVEQETGQLERAVRALRNVNPWTKLVLLCEPACDPLCRRAKEWGADDYLILPLRWADLMALVEETRAEVLTVPTVAPAPAPVAAPIRTPEMVSEPEVAPAPHPERRQTDRAKKLPLLALRAQASAAQAAAPQDGGVVLHGGSAVQLQLLSLPLMVETAMIESLLQGRADFKARAVATLQGYLPWRGKLVFVPATPAATADSTSDASPAPRGETLAVPVAHDGTTFGTLTFEAPLPEWSGALASQLGQAAAWLGGWIALAKRQEQFRLLAITDELSGAYNRRYFQKFVSSLLDKARGQRFRVSLLLFDIDDFKQYNDRFGHAAGDSIIRQLIALLRRCTRTHDLVARIGGDEFAVVFWDSEKPRQPNSEHPRDALAATVRFRKAIENHDWEGACQIRGQVSISGGIATFPWDADTLDALVKKADDALLRAKRAGKNVIILHEPVAGAGSEPGAGDEKGAPGKSVP